MIDNTVNRHLLRSNHHQVRLMTTAGIYQGRLQLHLATGGRIEHVQLCDYHMPDEPSMYGDGVVFDPRAVRGVHTPARQMASSRPATWR